jgi:hypothetical protein
MHLTDTEAGRTRAFAGVQEVSVLSLPRIVRVWLSLGVGRKWLAPAPLRLRKLELQRLADDTNWRSPSQSHAA